MSYCRVNARGRMVQQSTTLSGLGFSLKPTRWLRKAQPGVFIRKHPLILAPLTLAIPGVAPALLSVGAAAARGAAAGARTLFSFATRGIKSPSLYNFATRGIQSPAPSLPPVLSPVPNVPVTLGPVANPGPSEMAMAASGGGGDLVGPPAPDALAVAAPAQAGMGAGALVIGALVLGGIMLAKPKRK